MTLLSDESTKSQSYELLYLAVEKAIRYVDSVRQRRVSPASSALAALSRFHEPFPSGSCNPTEVLKQLDALLSRNGGHDGRSLLWLREWRHGSRCPGSKLDGSRMESKRRSARHVSGRRRA